MRLYIGDGYDRTAFITANSPEYNSGDSRHKGTYPDCRINFRPMPYHAVARVLKDAEGAKDAASVYAQAIAGQVVGWSYPDDEASPPTWKPFQDQHGAKLQVTPANVALLPFHLFGRLRDIVLGLVASDPDPDGGQVVPTTADAAKN